MQTLAFWLVKFFLKLHSAASIFGIDKERVELLLLVSPFRSAHPSKFYQHSHYFVSSFFTFFILSRGSSPYIPITTWHPPSTFFFFFKNNNTRQTETLAHAAQLRRCAGKEPEVHLFSHRGFPITATVTQALGYLSGSSRLISVSTCLLCREFSGLMSTLISQHPLWARKTGRERGPLKGQRQKVKNKLIIIIINCSCRMKCMYATGRRYVLMTPQQK